MPVIEQPQHGDVWRSPVACRHFSVMHVCGHHDPPHVTGYWWRGESLDPCLHDAIPLPRFLSSMMLVEREDFGPDVHGCGGCDDPDCRFDAR